MEANQEIIIKSVRLISDVLEENEAKEDLQRANEELKDLRWFRDEINKNVIPGQMDTNESAYDLIRRLRGPDRQYDVHDRMLKAEDELKRTRELLAEIKRAFADHLGTMIEIDQRMGYPFTHVLMNAKASLSNFVLRDDLK